MGQLNSMVTMIILTSIVMIGSSLFFVDWGSHYSSTPDELTNLNQTIEITNAVNKLNQTANTKITGVPAIDLPLVSVVGFVQFAFDMQKVVIDMWVNFLTNTAHYLGLPPWLLGLLILIVVFYIITLITSAIVRWPI